MTTAVASPCRKLCQLHPIERVCLGCFRTIDEIAKWARLSEAKRTAIVADLPRRRAAREAHEAQLKERRGE